MGSFKKSMSGSRRPVFCCSGSQVGLPQNKPSGEGSVPEGLPVC